MFKEVPLSLAVHLSNLHVAIEIQVHDFPQTFTKDLTWLVIIHTHREREKHTHTHTSQPRGSCME